MRSIRLFVALTLAAAAVLALPAGPASATHGEEEFQTVSQAELILPTRFPDTSPPNVDGGWPGLGRRVWNLTSASNGLIAFVFNVDQETLGGRFELQLQNDLTGQADLDIFFYTEFADFGGQATPVTTGEYATAATGGEIGAIPPQASKAVVFMRIGLDAFFTYRGYSPAAVHITNQGFGAPITVRAGQRVVWQNDDTAFHTVLSDGVDQNGDRLFNSSPNHPNQPIGQGSTFSHTFFQAGTFTYTDQYTGATGTVNVVGQFGFPAA